MRAVTGKWVATLIGSLVAFALIYALAVWTATGQTLENAALRGARISSDNLISLDDAKLQAISVTSLAVAILVITAIGFFRGGWRLGFAGGGTIVVSVLSAEALKRYILPRPDLIDASEKLQHNTLPSGHTTIAMSLLLATMLVVSYRWRGLAMLFMMTWATGIGALTIAAHWHRLSDTLTANALALAVASAAALWLARGDEVHAADPRPYPFRTFYVVLAALLAAASLAVGLVLAILNVTRNSPGEDIFALNSYYAVHSIAFGASILTALVFWYTMYRLNTGLRSARASSSGQDGR